MDMILNISEIFYSLQGEGHRAGTANVFVRLQGCKAKNACYALGIRCDTEYESGSEWPVDALYERIQVFPCKNIIWTGGEPLDQLTGEITAYFHNKGYYQAVETSGLHPAPEFLDFISISPKVAEHVIEKNFNGKGHTEVELRYIRHAGQEIPRPSIVADHYFISPHSDGWNLNDENVRHCITLIKQNPDWRLSIQQHKIWNVL